MSESRCRKLAALFPLMGLACMGLACAVLYSLTAWSGTGGWRAVVHALGTFLLVGGASFLGSGLVGFLFGFPRSVDRPENEPAPGEPASGRRYAQGRSIEQIADWVTKMLVGVGLSQMNAVPHALWQSSSRLTAGVTTVGGPDGATSIGVCLIVYFFVCGFIEGYLATRLLLQSWLAEAESKPV